MPCAHDHHDFAASLQAASVPGLLPYLQVVVGKRTHCLSGYAMNPVICWRADSMRCMCAISHAQAGCFLISAARHAAVTGLVSLLQMAATQPHDQEI